MPTQTYDIVTVGGGIAASAFARAMAKRGANVLVLERSNASKTGYEERESYPGVLPKHGNLEF